MGRGVNLSNDAIFPKCRKGLVRVIDFIKRMVSKYLTQGSYKTKDLSVQLGKALSFCKVWEWGGVGWRGKTLDSSSLILKRPTY